MSQSSNLTGRGGEANTNESNNSQTINILISTTTGTQFDISCESLNTIEHLKKVISKKLKVNKDKISLLFKERELQDGTLKDNGIVEGSKVVLTPNVETGLLTQRAENTVMQALESLNDSQVNDFLSGKSPLNLSVRLGDHMMLIQLQLSTINPSTVQNIATNATQTSQISSQQQVKQSTSTSTSSQNVAMPSTSKHVSTRHTRMPSTKNLIDLESNQRVVFDASQQQKFELFHSTSSAAATNSTKTTRSPTDNFEHNDLNSYLIKDVDNLESIVKSLSNFIDEDEDSKQARLSDPILEQSPIKSLSNLVSNSITEPKSNTKSAQKQKSSLPQTPSTSSAAASTSSNPPNNHCAEQIDPNLFHSITSCLCKRLDSNNSGCVRTSPPDFNPCFSHSMSRSSSSKPSRYAEQHPDPKKQFLHKTSHNAILKSKSRHGSFKKYHSTNTILPFVDAASTSSSSRMPPIPPTEPPASADETLEPIAGTIDNPALAEASRNLTQTLRKLSKKVFPRGDGSRRITSGAVIESMKHHGKGIYSGTFSGTLNPALQDKHGRPKRDISTIIHILNDLLSAAPQCTRSGAKIYFEPTTSVSALGSQSAPASPVTKSSSPQRRASIQSVDACNRCPSASSSSKMMRFNEDYSGTIKSSTHHRRRASSSSTSSSTCHNHNHLPTGHVPLHHPACTHPAANKVPSSLEIENSKTKYKLDQLRQVMQEKKARREARKLKNLPYHMNRSAVGVSQASLSPTTTTTITALASPSTTQPPASSPNANVESIIEEVDTVA
ncbi:LOW QUALITY PROTEIN: midnolin homolog [Culicoides brevitarsis]|uniref:LOW QUALITY PROTEIN: midnolin homolog n=1 Tax=Culicoides brevitarsis TaxID=469753 RepID=UPI00307BF698